MSATELKTVTSTGDILHSIRRSVLTLFRVSFGDNVDFIRQMTGLTSLRTLVSARRSRFFSKLHQSSLFQPLMPLFYDRMF